MAVAIEEAMAGAAAGEQPFGGVVVRGGTIVARARSLKVGSYDATAHAETLAVGQATRALRARSLADCTFYATCEPCPMCCGAIINSEIGTLVIGLMIAFKKTLSVPLILLYAVVEGLFMGAVSQFFNELYPGIVGQAVLATLATFAGMFLAYKFGLIKVTAKFRRIMTMMIFGYAIFRIPEHKGTNAIACGLCVFLSFFLALILIELCRPTTPTEDPDQTV